MPKIERQAGFLIQIHFMNALFVTLLVVLRIQYGCSLSMTSLVYGKDDALFGCIENQQVDKPFGDVLDAGTGRHSLRWLATLYDKGMTSLTAVTADAKMKANVVAEAEKLGIKDRETHITIGNWFPTESKDALDFPHPKFDTILADYLIGAMDGFSPYRQDEMIPKLLELLKPDGRLYIVGLEPIPDKDSSRADVICKVRQIRDACILLARHRCYREYPLEWIEKQVEANPSSKLLESHRFPVLYSHATIVRQIQVARSKFPYFPQEELVESMKLVLDDLEEQSKQATEESPIRFGFDYVVSIQKQ